jgi:hypothetical protein
VSLRSGLKMHPTWCRPPVADAGLSFGLPGWAGCWDAEVLGLRCSVMEITEKTDANALDCELGHAVNRVCLY